MAYQTVNPANNQLIKTYPAHSDADVEAALRQADALYHSAWAKGDIEPRLAVLHKLADLIDSRVEDLAKIASQEMGKLIKQSRGEVKLCAQIARYYADNAKSFLAPVKYPSELGEAWVEHHPIGVLLAVEPWNFPYYQLMRVLEPNLAVIGSVDLDDPENVIASPKLIETAKAAGTFQGSEIDNVIDYRASYAGRLDSADKRLVEGLNYLNSAYSYDADALVTDNSRFTISNIDKTGAIVPLYTNISADRTLDVDDILNYYKLSTIAKSGNQEIEIFQMFKDRPAEYATVGWVAVADLACNVFVPYYPMLIDSMYEGYQAGTPTVQFTTEQPTGGLFYPYSKRSYNRETGEITTTDGYRILPEGWEKSYYWSFEILNDYVRYFESADGSKLVSDADRQYVKAKLNDLQQEFYSDFVSMQTLQSSSNARKLATENGAAMAKKAQQTAQELIAYLQGSEALTRADAVYSLWLRSGSPKAKTSACPFADVSESAYYYDAVLWAAEAGIVRGVSDSSFAPDATCTRAQAAVIAYRAAGSPSVSGDGFADADAASYYAQPALWAKQIGAVSGSSFQPDSACSKAQLDALIGAIAA